MHRLYKITNTLNNKVYIGQSNNEIRRWRQHTRFAKQERPLQYVHRAMAKYGIDNFVCEVIAMCLTQEDADEAEIQLIKQYDSQNKGKGYNIASGGDHPWNAGLPKEQQPMYGKKQSEYFIARMTEVHGGKTFVHSENTKNQISRALLGRHRPQEVVDKFSGENNGQAKLSADKVLRIRQEAPYTTYQELADKYGTTIQNIRAIVLGETWRTLPEIKVDLVKMILKRLGLEYENGKIILGQMMTKKRLRGRGKV
jgi:group I intron endonuclease